MPESGKPASPNQRQKVLVVEDETATRQLISAFLKRQGYDCIEAWTASSALSLVQLQPFDFVILDLELEDEEGYQLLRQAQGDKPIYIVVSSRTDVADRLLSFELGADDYMTKPIDLRELQLRLQRSKKRNHNELGAGAELVRKLDGDLVLNMRDRAIMTGGRVHFLLNRREFKTLCLFVERPGKVITRDELARELTGRHNLKESRAIDVLVSNVRAKLTSSGSQSRIKNIRGEGYMFQMDDRIGPNEAVSDIEHG
jgi:DNA-binding response OmpR family regulator